MGALTGHGGAEVTPLVTEYLVEATSGGSCVLRLVSSAFGSGAGWEREFMDDAVKYWKPQFENLRVYLTTFPGQRATVVESGTELSSDPADVFTAMCDRFGATTIGDFIDVHGIAGRVEKITALGVLVRYTEPECGFLNLMAYPNGESTATPSPACTCSATVPPSWLPPKKQGGRNGSPSCRRPSAPTRCTRPVSFATRGGWHSHLTSARRVAPIAWRGSPRSTLGGLP